MLGRQRALASRCAARFDDCQRLVKEAFLDPALRSASELSSANSINLGRLLPQAVYYAAIEPRGATAQHGEAPHLHHSERQSRQLRRLRVGAQDRAAHRRDRARAQRQSHACPTTCETGKWQPRAERPDARVGDGRRQPEQHGAAASHCFRTSAELRQAVSRGERSTMRRSAARIRDGLQAPVRENLVSAYGDGGGSVCTGCRSRTARAGPLGTGLDRARRQNFAKSSSRCDGRRMPVPRISRSCSARPSAYRGDRCRRSMRCAARWPTDRCPWSLMRSDTPDELASSPPWRSRGDRGRLLVYYVWRARTSTTCARAIFTGRSCRSASSCAGRAGARWHGRRHAPRFPAAHPPRRARGRSARHRRQHLRRRPDDRVDASWNGAAAAARS